MIAITAAALAVAGCHKQQTAAQDQNIAIDDGVPSNQMLANADIETLPADESSETPSNQLENGFDNPDVNDLDTSNAE